MSNGKGYGINNYGTSPLGTEEEGQQPSPNQEDLGYGRYGYGVSNYGTSQPSSSHLSVEINNEIALSDSVETEGGRQTTQYVDVSDTVALTDAVSELDILLRVASAVAIDRYSVLVTFSNAINPAYLPFETISNYNFSPALLIGSVQVAGSNQVLIQTITPQLNVGYTVTVTSAESLTGDPLGPHNSANFSGFSITTQFIAGALSSTKIGIRFSEEVLVNANLVDVVNYSVIATTGGASIPVTAVVLGEPPVQHLTLMLGSPLIPKAYYAIVVNSSIVSIFGSPVQPTTQVIMWEALKAFVEIPIEDFSGEVSGGILGTPEGQVFFSPALEAQVSSVSTLEIEEVSVCTRAYDEYHIPDTPDPEVLFTYGPGQTESFLGQMVLFAPADRLGLASITLRDHHAEDVLPEVYVPGTATYESPISDFGTGFLVETIDITRGAFLNDVRWKTFPNTDALVFRTLDNATPVGPGPTTQVQLSTVLEVRLTDTIVALDSPSLS